MDDLLKSNRFFANGKNISLDHLHATGAQSRWNYENIFGIYVANPAYAWMAAWMAVTDRSKVRKRDIIYHRPSTFDSIGSIEIYDPLGKGDVLCDDGAYLYLIDPEQTARCTSMDISALPACARTPHLLKNGFVEKEIIKKGAPQMNYVATFPDAALIAVDCWQLALVNIPKIIPDAEYHITTDVIKALQTRIKLAPQESKEEYIL
jgi:hypothetical protein